MRFLLWISLMLLLGSFLPQEESKIVFGVRIATEANSQVVSYIAIKYGSGGVISSKRVFTSKDEFIRVLSGSWPSPFNPKRINYFELNKVRGGVFKDSVLRKEYPYCPSLDSLWKLRFSDWPYNNRPLETGWSLNRYKPGPKQEKYLCDRYNIKHLDFDYIVDTNFWNLMRDVSDSSWIATYKFIQ